MENLKIGEFRGKANSKPPGKGRERVGIPNQFIGKGLKGGGLVISAHAKRIGLGEGEPVGIYRKKDYKSVRPNAIGRVACPIN